MKTTSLTIVFWLVFLFQLNAQVTFNTVPVVSMPNTPQELAKGDFNNDGLIDFVSCNFNAFANQQVTIFLNTGTGTFTGSNKRNFASATNPTDVAVGDFNNDGKLDVVTCSQSNNNFSLLLGDGVGNLAAPVNFAAGDLPQGIAVGDMNKDGNPDVLVTNRGTPQNLYVYLGNGSGGFAAPAIITIPNVWDITVAEFNGDTNPDFAVYVGNTVQVWFGDGSGTAYSLGPTITSFGISGNPIASADLDGDGDIDILAASGYTLNDGSGNFSARVILPQTGDEYTVADVNKDTHPDIIANDNSQNTPNTRILLGDGTGVFTLLAKFETNGYARGLEVADVNNDNNPDIVGVGSWGGVPYADVLLGDGTGYFTNAPIKYPTTTDPRDLVKGDFNEDGKIDIAITYGSNIVSIYLGQGNGRFAKTPTNYATGVLPQYILTIDYNKDNHLDLVTLNWTGASITVFTGAGDGTFTLLTTIPVTALSGSRMTVADFNNDTFIDIAVSGFTNNLISILAGTGSGFSAPVTIPTSQNISEIKAADFTGDGKQDIIASFNNINRMVLFTGNGSGGFTEGATQYVQNGSFFLVDDMNGDNNPDVITFSNSAGDDYFINDGSGNFTGTAMAVSLGGFPWGYDDMNGDGIKDLIVGSQGTSTSSPGQIVVFRGTVGGISNSVLIDKDFSGGNRFVLHDLNGDSKQDIITTSNNLYEDYMGVLINTTTFPSPPGIPTITSFSPTTAAPGTSVTIMGTNLGTTPAANQVFFGATKATVTAASATQLTVTVPPGAIYTPITVTTGGLTAYSATHFLPTFAGGGTLNASSFAARVDFNLPNFGAAVAVADLDGDGKPEMIGASTVSIPNTTTVSIFRNTSTMGSITATSFAAPINVTGLFPAFDFVVADLDSDGKLDIICSNPNADMFTVLKNTSSPGAISFSPKVEFSTGVEPRAIAICDLDKDAKPDIIIKSSGLSTVSVYRNVTSTGIINASSFAPVVDFPVSSGGYGIAVADLDADNKQDIVVTNQTAQVISVLKNTTSVGVINSSSFAPKIDLATIVQPYAVHIADVDGDNKPEIIVTNDSGTSTLSLYQNKTTAGTLNAASFSSKVDFVFAAGSHSISVADLNGDQKINLAIGNVNKIGVVRNNSTSGTIDNASIEVVGLTLNTIALVTTADLDDDGKPELLSVIGSTIAVLKNQATGGSTIIINTQPTGQTVCNGEMVSLSVAASGTTNLTYQWQFSTNGIVPFVDISNGTGYSNATTATLSINTTGNFGAGFYRCRINGDLASPVFTNNAQLILNALPTAPTTTSGENCAPTSILLQATGGSNGQYRWYTVASGGTAIIGETNSSYTTPSITVTTTYYVSINNGTCESARTPVTATINTPPAKPTISTSGSTTLCTGQSVTLIAPAGFSYTWSTGATTQQIIVSSPGSYTVQVTSGTCTSAASDPVAITISTCNQPPVITTTTVATSVEGKVTINIIQLLSDPDNNLDLNSLKIVVQPKSGASASFDANHNLLLDYKGLSFAGSDELTIEVCDADGACTQQKITIEVAGNIIAFNGVSANGDNQNAIFLLKYIEAIPETKENKVSIYNRWGDLVWEGVNYDNTSVVFSGQNKNGNELPSGTYFYKIEFVSGRKTQTGYLALKK